MNMNFPYFYVLAGIKIKYQTMRTKNISRNLIAAISMTTVSTVSGQAPADNNPLLQPYGTHFNVPPFADIQPAHFLPAFEAGMQLQQEKIKAITAQKSAPGFDNTIAALEQSGKQLQKAATVFFNLTSANTSPELEALSRQIAPRMAQHSDDIYLNPELFARVKAVYDKRATSGLTKEQERLLEKTYKAFVRSGAKLNEAQQTQLRGINRELSLLTVQFGQHLLAETNGFEMIVDRQEDLAGLPASIVAAAAASAKEAGQEGLSEREIVKLDDERRATMVSNLLVVLCGDRDAQPVVNTGSLYA